MERAKRKGVCALQHLRANDFFFCLFSFMDLAAADPSKFRTFPKLVVVSIEIALQWRTRPCVLNEPRQN